MPDEIASISGGGGVPSEALVLTGNCGYKFYAAGWDWFIDEYGNQITSINITNMASMFRRTTVTEIPFTLNCDTNTEVSMQYCFANCDNLETLPFIIIKPSTMQGMFMTSPSIKEITSAFASNIDWTYIHNYTGSDYILNTIFSGLGSLRTLSENFLSNLWTKQTTYFQLANYGLFNGCYVLDEVVGVPVVTAVAYTSNMWNTTFNYLNRAKRIVFATDNGTPYTARWKNQTIDISGTIGFANSVSNINITSDKRVTDAASYETLKNDPDWWTTDIAYSRYNHDSAVETINSLPDTSAYLATAGGTNTIKFKGVSGSLTDGGAINTLTSEEIAVATAKGWTVTLT